MSVTIPREATDASAELASISTPSVELVLISMNAGAILDASVPTNVKTLRDLTTVAVP